MHLKIINLHKILTNTLQKSKLIFNFAAMKNNTYTYNSKFRDKNDTNSIVNQLHTSLFYEINIELFLLTKTFKEKLVVIFANIRV